MLFTAIADGYGWFFTIKIWVILMAVLILLSGVFLVIWTRFLKKTSK
jgi:hypothetical protein